MTEMRACGDAEGFRSREDEPGVGMVPSGIFASNYDDAQYCDPASETFASQDPKGFAAGDPNLFRFGNNDPVNNTDPSGMMFQTGTPSVSADFSGLLAEPGLFDNYLNPAAVQQPITSAPMGPSAASVNINPIDPATQAQLNSLGPGFVLVPRPVQDQQTIAENAAAMDRIEADNRSSIEFFGVPSQTAASVTSEGLNTLDPISQDTAIGAKYVAIAAAAALTGGWAAELAAGLGASALTTSIVGGGVAGGTLNAGMQLAGGGQFSGKSLGMSALWGGVTGGAFNIGGLALEGLSTVGSDIANGIENVLNGSGRQLAGISGTVLSSLEAAAGSASSSASAWGGAIAGEFAGAWNTVFSQGSGAGNQPLQNHHGIPFNNSTYDFQNHPLVQQAGANLETDPRNQFDLLNHMGRHTTEYNEAVQRLLDNAYAKVAGQGQQPANEELGKAMEQIQNDVYQGKLKPYANKEVSAP